MKYTIAENWKISEYNKHYNKNSEPADDIQFRCQMVGNNL